MDLGISNKRVLITGASHSIGVEIARYFVKEGCRISLIARNHKNLEYLLEQIGGTQRMHDYLQVHLRKLGAPINAVNYAAFQSCICFAAGSYVNTECASL